MGGKTQTTNQQSSSTPTGFPLLADIYNRVSNVASQPYTPYSGNMVAGLSGTQQAGIQGVTNAQGAAQPYFDQAAQYAQNGAAAIDPSQIQRYMSPYTQNVIDATKANFQQDNAIGQQQVIGNAAAKGALGGDRVGVAQAELARQQGLAQNPVIAGLYSGAYDKALGAAQQDRAAQAQGAYTYGALAPSVQNAKISGAQAQIGAGGLEQGTQQAQLTADYNKYLQQLAFPYQQAGFLASAGLPAVNAMGGTTTGQTTAPGPNPWGQVAGLGLTAASFLKDGGVVKGYAGGGPVGLFDIDTYIPKYSGAQSMSPYGQAPALPKIGAPQASGFNPTVGQVGGAVNGLKGLFGGAFQPEGGMYDANMAGAIPSSVTGMVGGGLKRGGRVSGHPQIFRSGGRVTDKHAKFHATVHAIRQTLRGGYAGGGVVDSGNRGMADLVSEQEAARDARHNAAYRTSRSVLGRGYVSGGEALPGYAVGGDVASRFDDAFSPYAMPPDNTPANRDLAMAMGDKYQPEGEIALNAGAPMPRPRPFEAPGVPVGSIPPPDDGGLPPQITGAPGMPAQAMAYNGVPQSPYAPPPTDVSSSSPPPSGVSASSAAPTKGLFGNPFGLSDEARTALLSAGLGTLASRSPFALSALGEGGLQGIKSYTEQKASKQKIDSEARKLAQQAEQFAQNLGLHRDQFAEQKRQHDIAALKPETIGFLPNGTEIKGVRDVATNSYRLLDPKTGKLLAPGEGLPSGEKPAFVDPKTGKPINETSSADGIFPANAQLVSSGTPYNYSADAPYIEKGMDVPKPAPVSGKSTGTVQTDAEYYLQTGKLPPVAKGRNPVAIAMNDYRNAVQNYATSLAQSRGITPEQTANMWREAPGMLRFILGADGRSTVALGTAARHLDTVQQLAKAWGANDVQAINRLKAMVSRQFGSEAATNLEAAGRIVGPEIVKAIGVAGAGTEHDRNTISAMFSSAASPAQLAGAVETVQKLLAGQLEGKKKQAAQSGVSEERFKNLIGDRPYEILSTMERGATATTAAPKTFKSPSDVQAAIKSGEIKKGDTFLDANGTRRTVP